MKFRTCTFVCIFVLGLFACVVFDSGMASTAPYQSQRMDAGKLKALGWTKGLEDGVRQKFNEIKILLEYYHNVDRSDEGAARMALLLYRQGTIIEKDGEYISGEENIKKFLLGEKASSLNVGPAEIVDVGFLNRVVEGHKVDHYVKLESTIKMVEKRGDKIVENDDYTLILVLMHRNNCPWDG
jgi:hypothetical protein